MKKFLLIFLSFLLVFNYSFIYAGESNGGNLGFSEESDDNKEGGGSETDNWTNSFWYGKVEDIDGKFGISI